MSQAITNRMTSNVSSSITASLVVMLIILSIVSRYNLYAGSSQSMRISLDHRAIP